MKSISTGTNILVTGGVGFIGSDFVRLLDELQCFDRIYLVDSLTYASDLRRLHGLSAKIELIESSVVQTKSYENALKACHFVVHFAAESHVDRSIEDGTTFIESNIVGTYQLLEVCRQYPNVNLLHISTDEVYGSLEFGEADECAQINPASVYSASKASSDLLVMANWRTHKQNISISRCTNNFGPWQNSEKFIPKAINSVLKGDPIPIYGTGSNQREWIYVTDHSKAILAILRNFTPGQIFNIGSGFRYSNLNLAQEILKHLGAPKTQVTFVPDRKGHDYRYALSSIKLQDELDWKPETTFLDGLKATIQWYETWYKEWGEAYE